MLFSDRLLGDDDLQAEIIKMTDHFTLDLFTKGVKQSQVVRSPVSRLVLDVERFEDDHLEPMAVRGMGVVYNRTSEGKLLRKPIDASERQQLIDTWYRPHHNKLTLTVQKCLERHDHVLVIDAHSFPSVPLPYETDQNPNRPQICIGTDDFHTSPAVEVAFNKAFTEAGFDTRLNAPFAGAIVPMDFYKTDKRVQSIMIEVNRRLYLDEATGERNEAYEVIATKIRQCIDNAVRNWGEKYEKI
ncbi:N-formylglutamate amidohydrolase [Methylophaga sp.]|uniref:N-formylglutamate amidohydrolase n=1 Tax=Methylophaga sp. TaxID=2024840 RepID=UPI002724D863|nr:N-formylglutamate amidohydrolase [Methylophaga sp.]MDO8828036.1 N-formylglutamate amidohydrolase [Methylophaga sp.]